MQLSGVRESATELTAELPTRVITERFKLIGPLGEGGMAKVYRAWQRSVGREVALKLFDPSASDCSEDLVRFQREAELAAQLSHPAIITVFDHGHTASGQLFIAMELVPGETLFQNVQRLGAFAVDRVVRIGIQLCEALEVAHQAGIVHRDLKLENVMLVEHSFGGDRVKVLDFGLAKLSHATGITARGSVVGTAQYIAPEAVTTGQSDAASDAYALGVLLAELAFGGEIWRSHDLLALQAHKLNPERVTARLPEPLRQVVGALLEPNPERRTAVHAARALLEGLVRPEGLSGPNRLLRRRPVAPSTSPPRRSKWPVVAAGIAAVFVSVAAATFLLSGL